MIGKRKRTTEDGDRMRMVRGEKVCWKSRRRKIKSSRSEWRQMKVD